MQHTHALIMKQVNESSQVMLTFCLQKTLQKNTCVERILVQNTTTFPRAISNNVTQRPELAAVRGAGHNPGNSYQCDEIVRGRTGCVCLCVCVGLGGGISCTTLIVHAQHRSRATAQPTQLSIVYTVQKCMATETTVKHRLPQTSCHSHDSASK